MKCKKCGESLKRLEIEVEDSNLASEGFECKKCGQLYFNEKKSKKFVEELKRKDKIAWLEKIRY